MPQPIVLAEFHGEPMDEDVVHEENENMELEEPLEEVLEDTSPDLEYIVNNYIGIARLNRLIFIADRCPSAREEALKLAYEYVRKTRNTDMYEKICHRIEEHVSQHPDRPSNADLPKFNKEFADSINKEAAQRLERLDIDLKNYRSNSIKESIRRGHDDLGDFYLDMGDLPNALKCYSRARDYCTSAKHLVNMCMNVIKVSAHQGNWQHVLSYANKAESSPEITEAHSKDAPSLQTKLRCAAGLAELNLKMYKSAARYFLQANFDNLKYPELVSHRDVAVYGGLCALASFDRQELQKNVLSTSNFKLFLEQEPLVRDTIHQFFQSSYTECLKTMDKLKNTLKLDLYLAPHVNNLYKQIRQRALCQYFSPYLSVNMRTMAKAFNTNIDLLEDELMKLILDGRINARIDSHNKILHAKDVDQRSTTFEKALALGYDYQRRMNTLILRTAVIKHDIQVKAPQREAVTGDMIVGGAPGIYMGNYGYMPRN